MYNNNTKTIIQNILKHSTEILKSSESKFSDRYRYINKFQCEFVLSILFYEHNTKQNKEKNLIEN